MRILLAVFLLQTCVVATSHAQEHARAFPDSVQVHITGLDSSLQGQGVTVGRIRAQVEARLRQHRVTVADTSSRQCGILTLDVMALWPNPNQIAYLLELQLCDIVAPLRELERVMLKPISDSEMRLMNPTGIGLVPMQDSVWYMCGYFSYLRSRDAAMLGIVWIRNQFATAGTDVFRKHFDQDIEDIIDVFAKDWESARGAE